MCIRELTHDELEQVTGAGIAGLSASQLQAVGFTLPEHDFSAPGTIWRWVDNLEDFLEGAPRYSRKLAAGTDAFLGNANVSFSNSTVR